MAATTHNVNATIIDDGLNVEYIPDFYGKQDADSMLAEIACYDFEEVKFKISGREFIPTRKVCAFAVENLTYRFSGACVTARPWTPLLSKIKVDLEKLTGASYNFVLLNLYPDGNSKISPHKDNERDLDSETPIATMNLGATRCLQLSRQGYETKTLPLHHGSVYTMNYPTNVYWKHGIAAEPSITESRYSLTFRKMKAVESKVPVCDENLPPRKKPCLEAAFQDATLDTFFSNLDVDTANCSYENANETILKKNIGEDVFVTVELFKGTVKVHIREFVCNANGIRYPTKTGVTMELSTWYEFISKFHKFNLFYSDLSFVANNSIAVLSLNNVLHFKTLNVNSSFIQLSDSQMNVLKDNVYEITNIIVEYLITKHLPFCISRECELSTFSSEEEDEVLMSKLIISIENELASTFRKAFFCNGCKIDHPSQRQHTCLSTTNLEKYKYLGERIFLMLNIQLVVTEFLNSVQCVSQKFIDNITFSLIKDVVFESV